MILGEYSCINKTLLSSGLTLVSDLSIEYANHSPLVSFYRLNFTLPN